ncbi:MAG: class I SAM-dependent methyltransferase [Anaerolineae bacterium]|nr:class I SAM-dependent methyltransferase [Anaerolineae bacterium]
MTWNGDSLFPLGAAYQRGQELAQEIGEHMVGRIAGYPQDHGALAQAVYLAGHGDHLEIGTLFGGSAILAARIKQDYNLAGKVVCVDPMQGYYGKPDPFTGLLPSEELFWENAGKFGVTERMELVVARSKPWPLAAERRFASALIDGDHSPDGVRHDWQRANAQTSRYVVFDNYDKSFPGVRRTVRMAGQEEAWRCVLVYGISAVFERVQAC